jgi:hypothetical protein
MQTLHQWPRDAKMRAVTHHQPNTGLGSTHRSMCRTRLEPSQNEMTWSTENSDPWVVTCETSFQPARSSRPARQADRCWLWRPLRDATSVHRNVFLRKLPNDPCDTEWSHAMHRSLPTTCLMVLTDHHSLRSGRGTMINCNCEFPHVIDHHGLAKPGGMH